jgi:hypothetical protein
MKNRWQEKILSQNKYFNQLIVNARKNLGLSVKCYEHTQKIKNFWLKYSKSNVYQNEVKKQIHVVLNKFGLEKFWFMGILNYILKNKLYKPSNIWIKQIINKDSSYLSINIGECISKKQLIDWIKNNWNKLENKLKPIAVNNRLPKRMDDFNLYQEIYNLRTNEKKSFEEISEILNVRMLIYYLIQLAKKHKIKTPIGTVKDIEKQIELISDQEKDEIYDSVDKINSTNVSKRYHRFVKMINE